MSKICEQCNRGPQVGNSRSHSMIKTKRRFNLNMQSRIVDGKRIAICAKCLKTAKKKPRA